MEKFPTVSSFRFSSIILLLFCVNIVPGWTSPSPQQKQTPPASCSHPKSVPNAIVHLLPPNVQTDKHGKYPSGTEATIDCYHGYHLKHKELKYLLCNEQGEWISSIKQPIEAICQRDTCGPPPSLHHHGYYKEDSPITLDSYPVGVVLKPYCKSPFSLNCSNSHCGRLVCGADGNWSIKRGDLKAACILVGEPLPIRSSDSQDYDEDSAFPQITCDHPPKIDHGFYTIEKNHFKQQIPASESYPVKTVLHASCEKSFSLNCTRQCGRILCEPNGRWAPKDEKFITSCVAEPLLVRSNPSNGYSSEGHGTGSDSSIKHYLVLALAVISILAVCILTVVLLRRPAFCKKSRGTSSSNGNQGGGGGGSDVPVIITSSSPRGGGGGGDLDSLPVAMNTGIFLPGAGYDLQDCHFQDSPLCGTSVFK